MKRLYTFSVIIFFFHLGHGQTFNATITGGYESGAFICGDGYVFAWGEGGNGEIGNNAFADKNVPTPVKGINNVGLLNNINYINGATGSHVLALKADTVIWWGTWTGAGGAAKTSSYPIYLSANAGGAKFYNVKDVYSGVYVSYAIKNDGTLWAWGSDDYGKLGDNNTPNSHQTYPVQVVYNATNLPLTNIISVAAGDNHAMALRADGTVWTWGYNNVGQLGNGNTTTQNRAVQVKNSTNTGFLTGVKQITAIDAACMALDSSDRLWAWGDNWAGQLGVNPLTYASSSLPIRVSGIGGTGYLTNVLEIRGGNCHAMVLLKDGTIAAFGRNNIGQLGRGVTGNDWIPQLVRNPTNTGPLTKVARIYRGDNFNFAADSLGNMYTWGDNTKGQLALGNNTSKSLPTAISLPTGCTLVLPVELYEFNLTETMEKSAILNWTTTKEENFSHFIVQRSFDGSKFESIGKVKGNGNSTILNSYSFTDNHNALYNNTYYRLVMVDRDGQFNISTIIHRKNHLELNLALYPNPIEQSSQIYISYESEEADVLSYKILSILGEEIYSGELTVISGHNLHQVSIDRIKEPGMYIFSYTSAEFQKNITLIKN